MTTTDFSTFFSVLQSGDQQAVEEILRAITPFLRQAIRLRLIDGRLRRAVDPTDILQSLLKDFLRPDASISPVGIGPGGVCAYLVAAVRNKIRRKARKERRHAGSIPSDWDPPSTEPAATQDIDVKDLNQAILARISDSDRQLFDLRMRGLSWPEIAAQTGVKPDTLRMRFRRAVAAVLAAIGHEELNHAR